MKPMTCCLFPTRLKNRSEEQQQREERKKEIVCGGRGERRHAVIADFAKCFLEERSNAKALDHHAHARRARDIPALPRRRRRASRGRGDAGHGRWCLPGKLVGRRALLRACAGALRAGARGKRGAKADCRRYPGQRDADRSQNCAGDRTPREQRRHHPDPEKNRETADQRSQIRSAT